MPNVRFAPGAEGSQSFVGEGAGWFTITLLLSQPSAVPVTVVRPCIPSAREAPVIDQLPPASATAPEASDFINEIDR